MQECERVKKNKRRFWVRKIFLERKQKSEFNTLVKEMKLHDHEYFKKQFRMSPTKLEELLSWVAPKITKTVTRSCEPIGAEERLCATLRYLATGDAQVKIAESYRISPSSIGRIIKETTAAIWEVLSEKGFITYPNSTDKWIKAAEDLKIHGISPNCLGAID